jgi:hypothetical protein
MLEVGNGGMKNSEYVVHFSLWAISKVTGHDWQFSSLHFASEKKTLPFSEPARLVRCACRRRSSSAAT